MNDSAFAAVRQDVAAEREALAAVAPTARATDLATLADLRAQIPGLPLKRDDAATEETAQPGFWQRAGAALGSIVRVSHDDGTPGGLADARIARELAALDVAQAEAAVLAYDDEARERALKRVDASLAARFDTSSSDVQAARSRIAALLATRAKGAKPALGGALSELRNLRSVHALHSGTAVGTPASSASSAAPAAASSTGATPEARP